MTDTRATSNPKDSDAVKEIFDGLFEMLENMETQTVAILQFLKDHAGATDEKLKPYLDQASNAASVKWRAHRARMEHLFSPIPEAAKDQKEAEKQTPRSDNGLDKKDPSAQSRKPAVGTPNPITGAVSSPSNRAGQQPEAHAKKKESEDGQTEDCNDKEESSAKEAASAASPADRIAKPEKQSQTEEPPKDQKAQTKSAS